MPLPTSFSSLARQVTSLQAKTKRARKAHRALADGEEQTVRRHLLGSHAGPGTPKPTHSRRYNASEVDVWAFKGVANFTRDPAAANVFLQQGVVVELSNSAGVTLDTVVFAANECREVVKSGRRILCKHVGGPSKLTMVQQKANAKAAAAPPVWMLNGRFPKQDIVGDIAATPLVVTVYGDIAYVDR